MADKTPPQESKVEGFKKASDHLRGTIADTLAGEATHFEEADIQLLKFHGSYQQDNRDERRALRAAGKEKAYSFMVRVAIPGGVVTADQYLALDALADNYAGSALRVTTRQGFQFHGVLKRDLKTHIAAINDTLLTTLSACGDVGRNVMACPAPLKDEAHQAIRRLAREIAVELRPKSNAYHEIWLDDEKVVSTADEEPFYGDRYLPRKFKAGVSHAGDNSIDLYSYDCGLMAFIEKGRIAGFNVVVGGGMGMTHKKADTFAALAQPLGYIDPACAIETVRTVAAIFRDHGNRADRRHARLKYLLAEWGMPRFREEFTRRVDFPLGAFKPMPDLTYRDYVGPNEQDDGRFFYGVSIPAGRIVDREDCRLKTALRTVIERHAPGVTLTANQNVLLTDLEAAAVEDIAKTLTAHGVTLPGELSAVRRYAMACPALPTCGLAMAESERVLPEVVTAFETELAALGLADEPLTLRMTGCPNGCSRPYTADIGLVGRAPEVYHVFVGGGLPGNRLADLYAADVPQGEVVAALHPLLNAWRERRLPGESLSDFYQRAMPPRSARQTLTGDEAPTRNLVALDVIE